MDSNRSSANRQVDGVADGTGRAMSQPTQPTMQPPQHHLQLQPTQPQQHVYTPQQAPPQMRRPEQRVASPPNVHPQHHQRVIIPAQHNSASSWHGHHDRAHGYGSHVNYPDGLTPWSPSLQPARGTEGRYNAGPPPGPVPLPQIDSSPLDWQGCTDPRRMAAVARPPLNASAQPRTNTSRRIDSDTRDDKYDNISILKLIEEGKQISAQAEDMVKRRRDGGDGVDIGDDVDSDEDDFSVDGRGSSSKARIDSEGGGKASSGDLKSCGETGRKTETPKPPRIESNDTNTPTSGRNVGTTDLTSGEESTTAPASEKGGSSNPLPTASEGQRQEEGDGLDLEASMNTSDGREVLRDEDPHYNSWKVPDLRRRAQEIAKNEGHRTLVYGPEPDDCLGSLSSASKVSLVNAMLKRARWCDATDKPQDYRYWGPVTPDKSKKGKGRARHATASQGPRSDGSSVCRMIFLMSDEKLRALFDKANQEPTRDAQDAREIGAHHIFFQKLATAFIDEEWVNSNGNPISIPTSHANESPEAPQSLHDALDELDLDTPAINVRSSLFKGDDGKLDLKPLEIALDKWVKKLRSKHSEFIRRRDLSGGMGADKDEGGDAGGGGKDGVHKWDFCMGDLSLMLWDDLNQIMGDEGATTDTIFADNGGLASTSVKGGVGIQSADGKTPGDASGKHRAGGKRKQAQQASDDRQETMVSVRKLLETLTETESKEASARGGGGYSAAVADPLTAVEDLVKKAEETRKTLADLDDGAP